ncbi:nucleoside hydrolase [Paenibacillus sp. OV219]|uniref:nucleoside hydrolase n=1 Tax=Paenibacillus sp. OV219 TaxID=1884377 RepID=UPI0008C32A02|nr:nucleoside hydrolase [Paenibacillus sp. OV219]SEO61993.1 purine nucleosidase/pyrimidine-specific ribonucleoside hydrolase [Paenibacillus sp. OV219]
MDRTKIIIDTDIGDDIDDALAIAFALESPELEVIGITTVFKNVTARAKLAVNLLRMAGRADIPVFAGIGSPILNKVDVKEIPNQYAEEKDGHVDGFGTKAIDFIIDTVMSSDGDITIVPIGPLTNIAIAILKEPELKHKVKEIVMMGGCFYSHLSEWNIRCDPEAARVVFESGIPIKAVGLDVTVECVLTKEDVDRLLTSPKKSASYLPEVLTRWQQVVTDHYPMMHDPLAICAIFDDNLLEWQQDDIVVETQGEFTRGATYNKSALYWRGDADKSVIRAAKKVDAEAFIKLYMDRVCL